MKDSDWQILFELHKMPNITKVANKLYITQPSLTKRLQRIEEIFQTKIVTRTTKGVEFTENGVYLAEKAAQYMEFMREIRNDLANQQDDKIELVRVGSSYTFSKYFLPEILFEYQLTHPNTRFEVINEQSNLLFRKACDKDVDVAFVRGDYQGPVEQHRMDCNRAYIVTKDSCTLADLPNMARIDYKCSDRTKLLIDEWWEQTYQTSVPVGMSAGYVDVALQLVSKGLGYMCCFLGDEFQNDHNLTLTPMLDGEGKHIERSTCFIYKDCKKMSSSLKSFVSYVVHEVIPEMEA